MYREREERKLPAILSFLQRERERERGGHLNPQPSKRPDMYISAAAAVLKKKIETVLDEGIKWAVSVCPISPRQQLAANKKRGGGKCLFKLQCLSVLATKGK